MRESQPASTNPLIPADWHQIGPSPRNRWHGGIIAIVNETTGRCYFVASQNVGRRTRDNARWLRRHEHHLPELQRDWDADPNAFRFYLVKQVNVPFLLRHEKQMLIDEFSKDGRCYNKKRSVAKRAPRPVPSSLPSLGVLLALDEPPVPDVGARLMRFADEIDASNWGRAALGVRARLTRGNKLIRWAQELLDR